MTTLDVAFVIAVVLVLAVGTWALVGIAIETIRESQEEVDS